MVAGIQMGLFTSPFIESPHHITYPPIATATRARGCLPLPGLRFTSFASVSSQIMNPKILFPSPTCQPASRPRFRTCRTAHPALSHPRRSSARPAARPTSYSSSSRSRSARVAATMVSRGDRLNQGIADLYDKSSGMWENIWGDHMHHGFYDPNSDVSGSLSEHRSAQIRLIEEALQFAGVSEDPKRWPKNAVDVGCGIGGSSRYIAMKYGAKCLGITLSPVQAQRANALAAAEGLADKVSFQVADALEQPFPDGQFDLVWSMESGEHMPDKRKFVSELARVAAPGAPIIIVTWCHRDLGPSEESLQMWEKEHLRKISNSYYLPEWCSAAEYVKLLQSLSLQDIRTADWSQYVAPFWPAVIRSALTWKGLTSLLRAGLKTIRGALVMPLMIEGYKKDLIKFAIITCRKPE